MSASGKDIGIISKKGDHDVEWKITNLLSYTTKDEYYTSPRVSISDSKWFLQIYPNGQTNGNSVGWISLYLRRENDSQPPIGASFSFGMKKTDGPVKEIVKNIQWLFEKDDRGYGTGSLLKRSDLQQQKTDSPDAVTFTCSLWVYKSPVSSARLDTLSLNLRDMFISKRCCDATLEVRHEKFPVHKVILSARSPVFAAMFETDMEEKISGVVSIPDCDPVAFKDFLVYLYSGKFENISSSVFQLYKIADKYNVVELMSDCVIFIMASLSVENVLDAATLGDKFSIKGIRIKVQEFFNKNFSKIVCTAKWESFLGSNCRLANQLLKEMAPKIKL